MHGMHDIRLTFADGSGESFALMYEATRTRIFAYALSLAGERELAADAVQEAYIRLYQCSRSIASRGAVTSWLFSTARNYLLNHHRNARRFPLSGEDPAEVMDPAPEPFEFNNQQAYLRRLVDALRPAYREAVLLREYEGMSYGEIATITGVPVSTVKMRLFKARKALAELFRKTEGSR